MAGFLYFRPGAVPVTREDLVEFGLGYAFPRGVAACLCMGDTPSRSAGFVFADPERMGGRAIALNLAEQAKWRKLPKRAQSSADVYVSYWLDAPPVPSDLARVPQLPGYTVKLAQSHEWMIPLVRRFDKTTLKTASTLPTYMEADEDGNWHRTGPIETHAHLWEVTAPIADALLTEYVEGAPPREISDNELLKAVTTLLAENYVVGPGELSVMHALTSEASTHAAAMAACDWPTFLEWAEEQKKSASP